MDFLKLYSRSTPRTNFSLILVEPELTHLTEDGTLIVDLQKLNRGLWRFAPWAEGFTIWEFKRHTWKLAKRDPMIPVCRPEYSEIPMSAIYRYSKTIPGPVFDATHPFLFNQVPLLQWAAANPHARQLLTLNPILAWILIEHFQTHEVCMQDANQDLHKPMHELLHLSCEISSKSAVRLLKKVRLFNGTRHDLISIKHGIGNEAIIKRLAHFKQVPSYLFAALSQNPELLNCRWLTELIQASGNSKPEILALANEWGKLLEDTIRVGTELEIGNIEETAKNCQGSYQLRRLHDRLTLRHLNMTVRWRSSRSDNEFLQFPSPPLPGTKDILPIRTHQALLEEGEYMKHCVGSYASMVSLGKQYVYRVLRPERGTVSIEIGSDDFLIDQFKLKGNAEPSEHSWRLVKRWLESAKKAKRAGKS